jgi:hypothetical protein
VNVDVLADVSPLLSLLRQREPALSFPRLNMNNSNILLTKFVDLLQGGCVRVQKHERLFVKPVTSAMGLAAAWRLVLPHQQPLLDSW